MHHLPIRAHAATAVALLLVVALSAPDTWGGSVIRVPGDFATIQAAVDAARPGDTIQVGPGVYCENIVIQTSGLRLRTQPGANRAVIDGTCLGGIGSGIHVMRAEGVQIMGFLVEHFRMGIYLHSTSRSRVHLNEVRFNATGPGLSGGHGIILDASSFNAVDQNDVHDNGHLGIGVHGASSGNVVRGNRLRDNNLDSGVLRNCNLMVWNGATDNWIMENLLVGGPPELGPGDLPGFGTGIMIGQSRGAEPRPRVRGPRDHRDVGRDGEHRRAERRAEQRPRVRRADGCRSVRPDRSRGQPVEPEPRHLRPLEHRRVLRLDRLP